MATILTTPLPKNLTSQAVTDIRFVVPHIMDTSGNMVFDLNNIYVKYLVSGYDDTGTRITQEMSSEPFTNWPTAFKTAARDLYALVETDATNKGLILPGTADPLE